MKSAAAGADVVKAIKAHGSEANLIHANVTSSEDIKKLVQAAVSLSQDGKIDILVHNAGHGDDAYLQDVTEDFYTMQTNINIKGELSQCYGTARQPCKALKANLVPLSRSYISYSSHATVSRTRQPNRHYIICKCPNGGPPADSIRCVEGCQ